MQLLAKFEKNLYMGFRASLNFENLQWLCCVTKIIPTCSPVIGQFFDTMIVASIDKEW